MKWQQEIAGINPTSHWTLVPIRRDLGTREGIHRDCLLCGECNVNNKGGRKGELPTPSSPHQTKCRGPSCKHWRLASYSLAGCLSKGLKDLSQSKGKGIGDGGAWRKGSHAVACTPTTPHLGKSFFDQGGTVEKSWPEPSCLYFT